MRYSKDSLMTAIAPKVQTETDLDDLLVSAHRRAVQTSPAELASALQGLFGQQITAYIAGVSNPKAVGKWARGERLPRAAAESKMRQAYQVALVIVGVDDEETAKAWFMGMNPALDHKAPARVIANEADGGDQAMSAALAYIAYG